MTGALLLVCLVALTGCGRFETNHSGDPKSCRERVAYRISSIYPNPNDLATALDVVCQGIADPVHATTTTRNP